MTREMHSWSYATFTELSATDKRAFLQSEIDAFERKQLRAMREHALGIGGSAERLAAIEQEIEKRRVLIRQIAPR